MELDSKRTMDGALTHPTFRRWLRERSVSQVLSDLARYGQPISRQAAYGWLNGRSSPARERIPVLLEISNGQLGVTDITPMRVRVKPTRGRLNR